MIDKKNQISTKEITPREIALGILGDIVEKGSFSHTAMSRTLNQYQYLTKQDRAFITRLCEGTLERMITLDYILDRYSSVKVKKMKPFIRNLLRISLYQIKYMDQTPDSAACNEAVKLAKKRGFSNLGGFVNGVLRSSIRESEKVVFPEEGKEKIKFLSVIYSVPEWLVEDWLKQYDYEVVKQMLETFLHNKNTTIRCNQNKISPQELKVLLEQEQVTVEAGIYLPYALRISDYNYLNQLETFQKGYFQVQDESSMLVGAVASPKKGDYIIDVCAAPGGKALHLGELLNQTGVIDARDVSSYKVNLIRENITRLGYLNVEVKEQDALNLDQDSIDRADMVIADLPCSGLGVIGKKPDIKYNMSKEKIKELVQLQREILGIVSQYVKKGGVLLYSTCTTNKEENIENLKWFMKNYEFQPESIEEYLPAKLICETAKEGYIQLIPGMHGVDGFFISRLRKL